ncbi:hypothetical protein [Sandarakinorhabdus sp. DWP1-3-1]|uniref:hypothetical protein n=1 Tax=Sandarakinorhabdus sp. DWP1-3-1 TaxID=2804627 RepID=UPI003CF287EE
MQTATKTFLSTLLIAVAVAATPVFAQAQRPDTDFCARMRARDPGGICTPKGEYVTAEKVYLPDGKVINRTTGN